MQSSVRCTILHRYFERVIHLLALSLMLMTVFLGQTVSAQNLALPYYLSDTKPDSRTTDWRRDACNLLDGQHIQSIEMRFVSSNQPPCELRYEIPKGCTRFTASVGVDNRFPNTDLLFSFTVILIDTEGSRKPQPLMTAHSTGKPQPIDLDLTGYKYMVLAVGCVNNQRQFVDCPYLCWADARFTAGPALPSVWDDLAKQLMKGVDAKSISLDRFALDPAGFDGNIAQTAKDSLRDALKAMSRDVNGFSTTIPNTVKIGDDLPQSARDIVREDVGDAPFILGKITKDGDKTVIDATTYDAHTGKVIASGRVTIGKPPMPGGGNPPPLPPATKITLIFTPDSSLRIKSFWWQVDGELQDEKHPARLNSQDVEVKSEIKKHKIVLRWSGDGRVFKINFPVVSTIVFYDKVTAEFDITTDKNVTVDLSVKVDAANRKLVWTGLAGDMKFTPKVR